MIDFVKVRAESCTHLLNHTLLDFQAEVNLKTGELSNYQKAEYKGLVFKLYNQTGLLLLSGSLHYHFNEGMNNYTDFTFSSLVDTLHKIENKFKIDLRRATLQNIEFGINTSHISDVHKVLDSLLFHGTKMFDSSIKGNYRQVRHTEYYLKVYNKGKQFNLNYSVLRYELKFVKMRKLNSLGIRTLFDLTQKVNFQAFQELLASIWNEVYLFDHTLSNTMDNNCLKWSNPYYWKELKKMKRKREKQRYKNYVKKNGATVHNSIFWETIKKWNYLLNR